MKDDVKPLKYYEGIFDKYKSNNSLDDWCYDFPDVMWGLGYNLNAKEPLLNAKHLGLKLKEPKKKRGEENHFVYIGKC